MPKTKHTLTIALTGGGSGGHITPLLSLAHALKNAEPRSRVIYIGLKGESLKSSLGDRYQVFDEAHYISAGKFRRYHGESFLSHLADVRTLALNARDAFKVLAGFISARRLLGRIRPDVVLSKGGFVAVPVCQAARLLKIPVVTHDSDAAAGLANRIIGKFAAAYATGMPEEYYDYPKGYTHYTGIPVDERIRPVTADLQSEYKKQLGLPADALVLLAGGAGLGARSVNDKVISAAPALLERFDKLCIIHIAGQKHAEVTASRYQEVLGDKAARVTVIGFTKDFYKYTGAADVVITRAGATTIAEMALQRKAVILIPAPQLTGGHQLKNADILKRENAAAVVDDGAAPDELADSVSAILENGKKRAEMAKKIGQMAKPDAADRLASLLIDIALGKRAGR